MTLAAGVHWRRLHPLSPVIRSSRAAVGLVAVVALSARGSNQSAVGPIVDAAILGVVVVLGVVSWLVTRWAFDGVTLRIETGLLRRDARQLPVVRIQAVDLVQPFLARIFGLAELRIQMAGGTASSRLAYLSEPAAADLRAKLLAAHHGREVSAPEPAGQQVASVASGRLVGSVLLSGPTSLIFVLLVATLVLAAVAPRAAAGVGGVLVVYAIPVALGIWRRFSAQYGFTVALAPDGILVQRGLLGTVAETIPVRRVQAVRQVEPFLWRQLGWCRLEVDLAGVPGRDRARGSRRMTKTLLPVGTVDVAAALRVATLGPDDPPVTKPPAAARVKAPLSYRFLGAGHSAVTAKSVTGRVQRVTCWAPLHKAQSIRRVQGPMQRALGLATVHVDVAAKRVGAQFRDRGTAEADRLVDDLAAHSRTARRLDRAPTTAGVAMVGASTVGASTVGASTAGASTAGIGESVSQRTESTPAAPPGWFADPSGRHEIRYWDGTSWTDHVANGGVVTFDRR